MFEGIALSASERGIFTTESAGLLLQKAKAYDEEGLALGQVLGSLPLLSERWALGGGRTMPAAPRGKR
jgi:hypothetical protein